MNQNNERITNETLYPGYKDGQILQHTDVNKMIDVLKTGVNANYDDIKKMENGEKVVSKAASLNGLVATTFEDGTLDNSDETLPTSKKVKQYVDNKVSEATPTKGVDYFTEAEIQGIKNDIESNINEDMSTTINTAVTNGESAIDTYIANKEASANTSINNLASQKLDAITSASSTALSNISDAKDDALDSLDDALAEAESDFNSNASSKTSTFNTNATNRTTIYNDNASSKLSEYNTNSENKTTSFNDNYDEKLSAFNTNATNKTNAFDTNANNKTNTFDTVADRKITILQNLIATIPDDFGAFRFSVVQTLPETGLSMTLYLVPIGTNNDNQNVYEEYIWLEDESRYEVLGTVRSSADIDLSQYATISDIANVVRKTDYASANNAGVLKTGNGTMLDENNALKCVTKTYEEYNNYSTNLFISKGTLENVLAGKGYDNDIASLKEDRDKTNDLVTQDTIKSAEGTNIYLEDNVVKLKDLELQGDSSQKTYSGKNLLNLYDKETITINGVSITIKDGEITLNGTATSTFQHKNLGVFKHVAETPYQLIFIYESGSCTDYQSGLYLSDNSNTTQNIGGGIALIGSNRNQSINDTGTKDYYLYSSINSGCEFSNYKVKVQIIEGTTPDYVFEQFVGGSPSPNPSYPQNIDVVTGNQTIKVLGKNLYETLLSDANLNNLTPNINIDGSISVNGTVSQTWSNITKMVDLHLQPGTYTFSVSKTYNFRCIMRCFHNKIQEGAETNYTNVEITPGNTSKTITFNEDIYHLRFYITGITANSEIDEVFKIQLEKGNVATTFDKYKEMIYNISLGDIELCRINGVYNKIFRSENKWYLSKCVNVLNIDGVNKNAIMYTHYNDYERICVDIPNLKTGVWSVSQNKDIILSDKLINVGNMPNPSVNTILSWNTTNRAFIYLEPGLFNSLNEANEWLQSNNIKVYYVLETPVITEITNETLLAQLNSPKLFNGVNNIICDGDLAAIMKIDAYTNFVDALESKQDKLVAGTNIVIDGNKISATGGSTFSGSYNDLSDKPTLFSGSYNDLSNKPTIPDELKDLAEDSSHRLVTDTEKQAWNNKSSFSGNYNDLSNKPTLFSGSYNDLSNKPTIPTVPDIVDNLTTNDATKTLSAKQGKVLKDALDDKANADEVIQDVSPFYGASTYLTAAEVIDLIHANKMNIMIYGDITPLLDRSEGN